MRCKFCGAELAEPSLVCGNCGKDNQKDSLDMLQRQTRNMRRALMILLAVVALAALTVLVVFLVKGGMEPGDETQATTVATIPTDGNPYDETCKGSYTATDDKVEENHDAVLAVLGDAKLTNGLFNLYYWNTVYDFVSQYGSYAAYFGLDFTKPLDTQTCTEFETPMTWQQAFIKRGLGGWMVYQGMVNEAKKENFVLPDYYQEMLDELPETLEEERKNTKYETVEQMLQHDYGSSCTYEDYKAYLEVYYTANAYYEHLLKTYPVTDEQVKTYYEANKDAIKTRYKFETMAGPLVSVRHILITPESDKENTTTYTDEQWEACRVKAQQLYDALVAEGMTEEAFIQAAKENSKDGNAADGGIYDAVYKGQMVTEFENWCFDATRTPGSHGLVKTTYGYHLMFFVKGYEGVYPPIMDAARADQVQLYVNQLEKDSACEVDYKSILLSNVKLGSE